MRKVALTVVAAAALALAPAAYGHPSENRAETAFHGGPHCHINQLSDHFAFPSHRAHVATGTPVNIFAATTCP
ncbi:MAG TPA: hypothetical protein VFY91_17305 [Microbacterium sp.]|nr:hypothetical protein [Microbacterium sp.]